MISSQDSRTYIESLFLGNPCNRINIKTSRISTIIDKGKRRVFSINPDNIRFCRRRTRNYPACPFFTPAMACATIKRARARQRAGFCAHSPEILIDASGGMAALFRNAITVNRTGPGFISARAWNYATHDESQHHPRDNGENQVAFHVLDVIRTLVLILP
jgi:hypothetical protein